MQILAGSLHENCEVQWFYFALSTVYKYLVVGLMGASAEHLPEAK